MTVMSDVRFPGISVGVHGGRDIQYKVISLDLGLFKM